MNQVYLEGDRKKPNESCIELEIKWENTPYQKQAKDTWYQRIYKTVDKPIYRWKMQKIENVGETCSKQLQLIKERKK